MAVIFSLPFLLYAIDIFIRNCLKQLIPVRCFYPVELYSGHLFGLTGDTSVRINYIAYYRILRS